MDLFVHEIKVKYFLIVVSISADPIKMMLDPSIRMLR